MEDDTPEFLRGLFRAAVAAADPAVVLARHLPAPVVGRNVVIGAGKAAAAMAAAVEAAWGDASYEGVVVTRYGHGVPTRKIRVLEASHPVPDQNSLLGGRALLEAVAGLSAQDQVVALISGGASALVVAPAGGLTLEDKIFVNQALLRSGAPIATMNRIRKAISGIKGGRLAAACAPARLVTLAISDIPGDDPALIGSGPTFYEGADFRMIATPGMALDAAAAFLAARGIRSENLGDALEGEAAVLGRDMAARALAARGPVVLLSGGEATVTIGADRPGRGGRNTEFLLSLALALDGARNVYAVAGDTDGIDGSEDAAGAVVTPSTLARARAQNFNPEEMLRGHDSYSLFAGLGDLVMTGPTLTNVNDFRAIFVK